MFKSAYIVISKQAFLSDLFFKDEQKVREPFKALFSQDCFENLIYSGFSNFNINSREFWRHKEGHADAHRSTINEAFRRFNIDEIHRGDWPGSPEEFSDEFNKYLLSKLQPEIIYQKNPLFIKNLGEVKVNRSAIPFIHKSKPLEVFGMLPNTVNHVRTSGLWMTFGNTRTSDQSRYHWPLTVEIKTKLKISIENDARKKSLAQNDLQFTVVPRIHIYPYGLINYYILISVKSNKQFSDNQLIDLYRLFLGKKEKISYSFKNESFNSFELLFNYFHKNATDSIFESPNNKSNTNLSNLNTVIALNSNEAFSQQPPGWRQAIGLLTGDMNYQFYSDPYVNSFKSIVGKYKGDFVVSSKDRLLISLTTWWKNYKKRKSKIRYHWQFIHLFHYLRGLDWICKNLVQYLKNESIYHTEVDNEKLTRILNWIVWSNAQYHSLTSHYRKFYHGIYEIQNIEKSFNELIQLSNTLQDLSNLNERFPEDIDQFHLIKNVSRLSVKNEWLKCMEKISEKEVKEHICDIIGDNPKKDWGGEINDHFTTSISVRGKRVSAGFLFKGPSRYTEMKPSHLGKNADQVYRLSQTPCDLLVLQHAHLVGEAVRATLKAFSFDSIMKKNYCVIDGIDTYRILKAYHKI